MSTRFASLLTLGMLFAMVFSILSTVAYLTGAIDVPTLLLLTLLVNVLSFFLAPVLNDFLYRFLYKIEFLSDAEFIERFPELSAFVSRVCAEHHVKSPRIGIIADDNPTAFTYGSLPGSARLVFSAGIFTYLNPDEVEAVTAHELGHIVHYDFLVMTLASTLVQILYELYFVLTDRKGKSGNRDQGGLLALVGIVSYVFYVIATYVLLLLSRSREYYADEFSARTTGRPGSLSSALIKIAYGMVTLNSDLRSRKLLESTRALGIMDPHAAKGVGMVSQISDHDPQAIGSVLAFDFVSPWAMILELGSTHPLTGKRIENMENLAVELGQVRSYDIRGIINSLTIDKQRLFSGFYRGVFIYFLPNLGLLAGLLCYLLFGSLSFALLFSGLGIIIRTCYKFPAGSARATNLLELMSDFYASPARGKKVVLSGKVIGRGDAGSYLSEDLMFQDPTGLIYLDYSSKWGTLGNLFFALKKIGTILNQEVTAEGWFFRGNCQLVSLSEIQTPSGVIKSHPKLWSLLGGCALVLLALVF